MDGEPEAIRARIKDLLSSGLGTEAFPRGDSHEQVQEIVRRLQDGKKDLETKLVIGGFTLAPVQHHDIAQACRSCMYYFIRKRHCVLPELDLPVDPEWSCRLWRI
jgi:hypothetical protein